MNVKPTNPKDAVGIKKVSYSVVSGPVVAEMSLALLEGARKYGRHNYRVIGVRASVYYDATRRHMDLWWEGEDLDVDSGLSHVTKAMASLAVLRDAMIRDKMIDDRPPATRAGWMAELNDRAADIVERYPDAVDPYTEVEHGKREKMSAAEYEQSFVKDMPHEE